MSKYIEQKIDVNQYSLMPMCYDEMIAQDNPVRVLAAFVEALDMEKLGFTHSKKSESNVGRPSYNPKDMLKLYLYGYFNGIRSSRKLERECHRNIELFWLISELKPDFKTIADFRKDNIKCMKGIFASFSELCNSLNLIGREITAIDGSKFRASNARRKNYTKGKTEKQIEYYQENVEKYVELLDKMDKEEEETKSIKMSKEEIKQRIEEERKRLEELMQQKAEIEERGEISVTDPDSRHMKMNNNGTDICHNTQIAVDEKEHLVVAVDVTSSPADQNQLYNMSSKAKQELGVDTLTVLADKGYWNGEELKKCENENIITIVASPKEKGEKGFKKSDFEYNEEKDIYICPMKKELHKTRVDRYSNTEACKGCPNKSKCTRSEFGRSIHRNENEEVLERARQRQEENIELYKKRQQIVEHVFGTVKRALGFTHFLLRGNEKVKGESFMHFLIYNIKRVCNIVKPKDIMEAIMSNKKESIEEKLTVLSFF